MEEAGGRCGHILEGEATFAGPIPFLAANRAVFDEMRAMLKSVYEEWSAQPGNQQKKVF